jgi:GNAT superfamily N-acetyltransferase
MQPEPLLIRQLTPEDAPVVASFVARLLSELAPGTEVQSAGLLPVARTVMEGGSVTGFLALRNDMPVGLIMLNECAAVYAGGRFGEITELYVDPALRSLGVAAGLVERAVKHGKTLGWKRLEVGAPSQPDWARTLQFYLKNGFAETGPRLRRLL